MLAYMSVYITILNTVHVWAEPCVSNVPKYIYHERYQKNKTKKQERIINQQQKHISIEKSKKVSVGTKIKNVKKVQKCYLLNGRASSDYATILKNKKIIRKNKKFFIKKATVGKNFTLECVILSFRWEEKLIYHHTIEERCSWQPNIFLMCYIYTAALLNKIWEMLSGTLNSHNRWNWENFFRR